MQTGQAALERGKQVAQEVPSIQEHAQQAKDDVKETAQQAAQEHGEQLKQTAQENAQQMGEKALLDVSYPARADAVRPRRRPATRALPSFRNCSGTPRSKPPAATCIKRAMSWSAACAQATATFSTRPQPRASAAMVDAGQG